MHSPVEHRNLAGFRKTIKDLDHRTEVMSDRIGTSERQISTSRTRNKHARGNDRPEAIEAGVIEFLNSKTVLGWAEVTLGL